MSKVLCIYPGSHEGKFAGIPAKDFPDTQLYGYNHLKTFGIEADFIGRDDALPEWFRKSKLGKLCSFRLRHLLLFFKARAYDVVFGGALLYLIPLKKILGGRARYVLFNIELTRILRANTHRKIRYRFIVSLLKEFSAIVCLSNSQKEWLVKKFPFLRGKVFFVPLGVDTVFYQPVYEGRGGAILSVGRDGGRDYRTFIQAAELMPDTRFEIVCSPHNLLGIESIPENVDVFYDLSFAELSEKYCNAQMIVITTHDDSYDDGSDCSGQTVLLDAMAHGLPIIVTRKGYLSDYVTEGKESLIVEPYNPHDIMDAIAKLQDAPLRVQLARNARVRVESEFSTVRMAEGLASVFEQVCSN